MIAPRRSTAQRYSDESDALAAMAQAAAAAVNLPKLLSTVMDLLSQELTLADRGLVLLWDGGMHQLRAVAAFGAKLPEPTQFAFHPGQSFLQPLLEQGQALRLTARSAIRRAGASLDPATQAILWLTPDAEDLPRGVLAVPLTAGGATLGLLWLVTCTRPARLTARHVAFAQRLAGVVAAAIERLTREEQAKTARANQSADQLRSEVTATLSHELRTPLAAIKGYATALLLEEVDWSGDDHKEFLELIERECDLLQTMIGETLDSALLETGHLDFAAEPVRVGQLLGEAAQEAQRQTLRHRLMIDVSADLPTLYADPRRVRQVLRNILDNAIKYSPGGGLIVIRGETRPGDVVVSVADQGVGIAPENLIPLFDKYFRVKSAGGKHVPGTGLGLPISRGIIEAHGGWIWAESQLGHGTTIYFSLPRPDSNAASPEHSLSPGLSEHG